MSEETTHIRIRGRVQGVFYRQWTMTEARARGLSGWVRNRVDGTVEAVFKGEPSVVADMVQACRRGAPHGTRAARAASTSNARRRAHYSNP